MNAAFNMRIFAILLIAGLMLQICQKALIVVGYQLNKEYISKNICVKKSQKNNNCKGKCHLKKQLEKESQKENQSPVRSLQDDSEWVLFCTEYQALPLINSFRVCFFVFLTSSPILHSNRIFHPPPFMV